MNYQCHEIKALKGKHDSFNMHIIVKEAERIYNVGNNGRLHGQLIVDKREVIYTLKDYTEGLFDDLNRSKDQAEFDFTNNLPIMTKEDKKAISLIKNGKSPGPDNLNEKFFKLLDKEGIIWLIKVLNKIYNAVKLPTLWLKSKLIALLKKPIAKHCNDLRTISFTYHLLKLF